MWYLQVDARPLQPGPLAADFGGATINCWVDSDDEREAAVASAQHLADEGWRVVAVRESCPITKERQSSKGMKYFLEAEQHGIATLAFAWPRETKED